METRIGVKRLVLHSGIFKINPEKEVAEGVYQLQPNKNISLKLIGTPLKLRYFEEALTTTLLKYFNETPYTLMRAIKNEVAEIEQGISKILSDSDFFTEGEIRDYLKKITGRKFKNRIKEKLKSTGAFEESTGDRRYYRALLPLYQDIQKYLPINETDTYYYLSHFLIGCGIEEGGLKTVFNRIRKFFSRREGRPGSDLTMSRKKPSVFFDIP
jgi:hypothetical protein